MTQPNGPRGSSFTAWFFKRQAWYGCERISRSIHEVQGLILVAGRMDHDGEAGRYVLFEDKRKGDDDEPELVRTVFIF